MPNFRNSTRPRCKAKNYETYVKTTGIELSNYDNWNQFNQSYKERVVIDLVQTCPNTNSAKSCVEHPTSKIHTGLNTGPKLGNIYVKTTGITIANYSKNNQRNQSYEQRLITVYVRVYSQIRVPHLFPNSSCMYGS
jgi:hypothetical protein